MAFSTAQEQYIKSVVAALYREYPQGSYVAWNTSTSSSYTDDVHVVFATEGMSFMSSRLSDFEDGALFLNCSGKTYQYDIISSNVSSYNSDFSNRVDVSVLSETDTVVAVPAYNTISTDCDWTADGFEYPLAGDIVGAGGVYHDIVQSNTQILSLSVIGLLLLFVLFFSWVFAKR